VVLWLVDVGERFGPGDRFVAETVRKAGVPVLLGLNKIDLFKDKKQLLPVIDTYRRLLDFVEVVPISARTGENVERLAELLVSHLPESEPLYPEDFLTDQPERFFVSEMIRERILAKTREEIPYSTGVVIESFKEEEKLVRIEATIYVERENQKGILIGRGGAMLKAVGTEARREIEAFLGSKVYLGLFVKVKERWRESPDVLQQMGLAGGRDDE
jgi:GTP-binding protein Era